MAVGVDLVQVVFDRSLLNPTEDVAICTMHCRGVVAGLPDNLNPMDDTNRTDFGNRWTTFWNVCKPYISPKVKCRELRFYALPDTVGLPMGAPDKVIPIGTAGTDSTGGILPPQVAMSITFKTDQRKQWGRFYLPGFTISVLDSVGRFTGASAGTICNATHGLTSRAATGACLTVWSRKQWTHHDPQTNQVDDIPDVIRSRRWSFPITRSTISSG